MHKHTIALGQMILRHGVTMRNMIRARLPFALSLLIIVFICSCNKQPIRPTPSIYLPTNHSPILDSLIAVPDTIGPSDSVVVHCYAREPDGDSLFYDWLTDARLKIPGQPSFSSNYLNNQLSPSLTFINTNLSDTTNDSAWVYVLVRDGKGGGADRHVFIIMHR